MLMSWSWEHETRRKMEDPLASTLEGIGLLQEEIGEEEEELINWTTWATSNRGQKINYDLRIYKLNYRQLDSYHHTKKKQLPPKKSDYIRFHLSNIFWNRPRGDYAKPFLLKGRLRAGYAVSGILRDAARGHFYRREKATRFLYEIIPLCEDFPKQKYFKYKFSDIYNLFI